MNLCTFFISMACLAGSALAEITPNQEAQWADLKDYHKDMASFETLAARAVREGIPDSLITLRRYFCYVEHGEIAPLRALIPHLEKTREELLNQQFEPMTARQLDRTIEIGRKLIEASEKNPAKAAELMTSAQRMAQAQVHLKDLRMLDAAIDQYAIEHNKRAGDTVPEEAWKEYVPKNQRLWRTGADCLGNPYGPQVVDQHPKLARAAYERIAASVPKDYFKPFGVAEK